MTGRAELLERVDAVEERLAVRASATPPDAARTDPDPASGERWDAGQIWAHVAEFIPYWIEQASGVVTRYSDDPVPFGRTKSDPGRIGAIERDRTQPLSVLWSDARADIDSLRHFLERLDDRGWQARGLHPTLGVMTMERILNEFLVGHLEEHAEQLDSLAVG
ncbi:MAG: DinB family protein [Candidatus Dormibacteria bacterium]